MSLHVMARFTVACITRDRWPMHPCRATRRTLECAPLCSEMKTFPFRDAFEIGDRTVDSQTILQLMDPFLTDQRKTALRKVVTQRTFNLLPVIDGLINGGNIAAVMRTAEGMGCGAIHDIGPWNGYCKVSERCSAGAEKWLYRKTWHCAEECCPVLRSMGYQIIATTMSSDAVAIHDINWTIPTAVVFGNEGEGVSPAVIENADFCAVIPMDGFVESFNISVAAAIVLYEARRHRIEQLGCHSDLSPREQRILLATYYLRQQDKAMDIVSHLLTRTSL